MTERLSRVWLRLGRSLASGGRAAARHVRDLIEHVDPDARRHLLQLPLMAYTLVASRDEPVDPGEPDGHPPLVFVHGLGGSRGDFLPMAWYLRFHGRRRSYRIRFERGQSVDDMARALARFVRRVRKATGEPRVDIVAHSLGGVVTRLALAEHRIGAYAGTVVTLGSPLRGTWAARFAGKPTARDLRPDSDLIRRVNRKPWPRTARVFNAFSGNDLLVIPPESAVTEGAEAVDLSPFTHYSYLIEPRAWEVVRRCLRVT